jgi:hypothetical protein
MEINFTPKNADYCCKKCTFNCSKKSDWNRHLKTIKHNGNNLETAEMDFTPKNADYYYCLCGKKYTTNSGLWKHKKNCEIDKSPIISTDLILNIIQQNKELQILLIEQNKIIQEQNIKVLEVCKNETVTSTINTNSHNKTFNLNIFLNETCKDAMNIMDFVDSLKLQISDLENVGKLGFVEGISSLIIKNLNSMDETKRPIHCTDTKREVMYIKDEDKWEKDNDEKKKLRKAIKHIAHKNTKLLPEYRQKYPNCDKSISKLSDKYDKLVIEAFGGKGDNDAEKEDKIIHNIAKEVTIQKM